MIAYDSYPILPLLMAGSYLLLLLLPYFRRQQQQNKVWLILVIAGGILWQFALFFQSSIPLANVVLLMLIFNGALLGVATAVYLEWTFSRRVLIISSLTAISALLLSLFAPSRIFVLPFGASYTISNATLISYLCWAGINGTLLLKTWREFQRTEFPWHANRFLFWFSLLAIIFLGELVQFFPLLPLLILGQVMRFLGIFGLIYAVTSFRLFDVRTRFSRAILFVIINGLSALPLVLAVLLIFRFNALFTAVGTWLTVTLIALVIVAGFFLYEPYRGLIESLLLRFFAGERLQTNLVVRTYSQSISRTLDVQQLSLLIVGTISEILETNRGALLLTTQDEQGETTLDPVPAMGEIPRRQLRFPPDCQFIALFKEQHQPILQYDLDFNPEYAGVDTAVRQWLKQMSMELYIPVSDGENLDGLIAIGPKTSGVPYQQSELDLMQVLADQTVVALQNARLYSELTNQNERIQLLNTDLLEQNERLEIMDRVKSDFITIASHELRTPLTQVKGYADILSAMNSENGLTREQAREILNHINRATVQLESLIAAMLDASQLDVDGMQLSFVKTRLDTILKMALEPLTKAMRERRMKVSIVGVDELPPIYADFKRMVQTFNNLFGNALKYTPDYGRISCEARCTTSQDGEQFIEMVLADSGIGIDPQYHDLIFEKFFRIGDPQLHSTGSTKFKGAGPGLGLPIAKGVIEAHGGRIWVESTGEDEERLPGSRFHIVIPVVPAGADPEADNLTTAQPAYFTN